MKDNQTEGLVRGISPEERNTIHSFYNLFATRDFTLLDQILANDWEDIPLAPGQQAGAAGFKDLVLHFTAMFPDIMITILEMVGAEGKVGVRAQLSFTHTHEFMGMQASNKKVVIALHEFHYLEKGKIVKTWHLEDWMSMLFQTGSWPVQ